MSSIINQYLTEGYSLSLSRKCPAVWNELAAEYPVFFSAEYLRAIEAAHPDGFSLIYALLKKNNKTVAAFYFQVIDLSTIQLGGVVKPEPYGSFMKLAGEKITSTLIGTRRDKKKFMLVLGNMCVSGDYGIMCLPEERSYLNLKLNSIIKSVRDYLSSEGEISVKIIKDIPFDADILAGNLKSEGYIRFVMDPVMMLDIDRAWTSFDDYLQAITSKYRLRAQNVIAKVESFKQNELSLADIEKHAAALDQIYQEVITKSPVRIIHPDIRYIYHIKKNLPENFRVFAFFDNETPVAFYTYFNSKGVTYAHHIGMNYHLNKQHSIYQNILYCLIREAIQSQSGMIDFGRTAMEMKSTVGAYPVDYAAYLNVRNKVLNHLIKPFLPTEPPAGWVQRFPFRKPVGE